MFNSLSNEQLLISITGSFYLSIDDCSFNFLEISISFKSTSKVPEGLKADIKFSACYERGRITIPACMGDIRYMYPPQNALDKKQYVYQNLTT